MDVFDMTLEDKQALEQELAELKVHGRADVVEKIREARAFGDLSENAEYDIAKDEQAKMEARIAELEYILNHVRIYEKLKTNDVVGLGHTVKLLNIGKNEEITFEIVSSHSANPMQKKISNESPVGSVLIGKKKGDEVEVKVKNGVVRYRILEIS